MPIILSLIVAILMMICKSGLELLLSVEYLRYTNLFFFGVSGMLENTGIFLKILIAHFQFMLILN